MQNRDLQDRGGTTGDGGVPFEFVEKPGRVEAPGRSAWKVLSVEDDPGYQATLLFALDGLEVAGRPVQLLTAASAMQAARLLAEQPDIAVVLLDVVMERDDAGLRLVESVRDALGNDTVRIVLLTGQPGMAPRRDVMSQFDIDDYWCKSEIGNEQLVSVVTSNLRTWEHLRQLQQARQGLSMVVDACRAISAKHDLVPFCREVLTQIGRIIGTETGDILCLRHHNSETLEQAQVIAASGIYRNLDGQYLSALLQDEMIPGALLERAAWEEGHLYEDGFALLHFSTQEVDDRRYLTLVRTDVPLERNQINLLQVFSENVDTNFINVALHNRLSELAYVDAEIGCPNRNALMRDLEGMSATERRSCKLVVLLIEYLRDIVVSFGDDLQHQLLRSVYRKLHLRLPQARIARFHESGFALLLPDRGSLDAAFFERLFSEPVDLRIGPHMVSANVCLVRLADFDTLRAPQLLSLAEASVFGARDEGVHFRRLDRSLQQSIADSYSLLSELRSALRQRQFFVELQPKVRLDDLRLVGLEALVRWHHPDGHTVQPDQFIALAETTGLIDDLDRQVLECTCAAVRELVAVGIDVPVAFNACGSELARPGYFQRLLRLIANAGVRPEQLELEITESREMLQSSDIAAQLRALIDLGMGIGIDDFGTGYSSLSYMAELNATTLKIDRVFVERMSRSPADAQLVSTIVQLAARFGFKLVAEGVATEEQRHLLLQFGCEVGQGFLFGKPMTVDELVHWVRGRPAP